MSFDMRSLDTPVIVAPMAGGPTTPELAAAGSNAGGLGFLAGGYLTAEVFAERITAARALTTGPLGANVFVVRSSVARPDAVHRYAQALADESERYGVGLGEPRFDDDQWKAKLDVVLDLKPEVVSFTFGLPDADDCARLNGAGIATVATVTTLAEAEAAVAVGVAAVAVQGPAAGGHRGTLDPAAQPPTQPLGQLLRATTIALDVPVIAAGGLMTAADVSDVLVSGAVAAQLGTAFLLADEAGSTPVHRAALTSPEFTETVVTRCFSGRYARGLRNRFVDEHDGQAPLGYPELHYLTSPLRAASVRAGDPQGVNVWAGTGFRQAQTGSVAQIMAALV
ncbi:oxidoreductase [Mycolicibacterium madagascariense]|uniref:Propionate 3-nitronate monooxygenase n=1 Tax=Mycolicibacterium madagascariense TaxID=212765 RepID=A0A7I7XKN4_9MYCO|nr:nitronate monooxygenase [Mycolicibacterium madagascariense]BBZ29780.1 oxidoreductase [Mycolicibacterium madagascariense]